MGDAVVLSQFHHLGVDQNQFDIFRTGAEQKADDDRVDADGFTAAGGAGDQQVGHFTQVRHLGCTGNIFAQRHGQWAAHVDVVLGFKHPADADGRPDLVGHLDTDGGFAGNGGFDTHTGGGKVQGDIIRQAGDTADLDARLGLQLIPGHGRAAADIQDMGLNTKAVQRVHQDIGVFLHLGSRAAFIFRPGRIKKVQRWVSIRRELLFGLGGKGCRCFGHAGRAGNGSRSRIAHAGRYPQPVGAAGAAFIRYAVYFRRSGGRLGRGLRCRGLHADPPGEQIRYRNSGVPGSLGCIETALVKAAAQCGDGCNRGRRWLGGFRHQRCFKIIRAFAAANVIRFRQFLYRLQRGGKIFR